MSAVRILKKGLALLLALVVPLSLVIIENTADASNDAVDAMVAVDIIDSGGNSFDPDGTLTCEQATRRIAHVPQGGRQESVD